MKQVLPITFGGLSASSTNFASVTASLAVSGNENEVYTLWPCAGTFSNLYVIGPAPGSGKSLAFTFRSATAGPSLTDRALTATLANTATTTQDATNTVTVASGDLLAWKIVPSGTPTVGTYYVIVDFDGDTTAESGYAMAPQSSGDVNVNPNFQALLSGTGTGWNTTSGSSVANVISAPGTITALVMQSSANMVFGDADFYIWKSTGGAAFVRQDGTGGTPNTKLTMTTGTGTTTQTVTFSLSVAAGDRVYLERALGVVGSYRFYVGVRFVATTDGQSNLCGISSASLDTGSSSYQYAWSGLTGTSWTSEAARLIYAGLTSFTLSKLWANLSGAPGTGKDYTFYARKASATPSGTTTVTVADTDSLEGDTGSRSVTYSQDESLSLLCVPTGTPTSRSASWAMTMTAFSERRGSFVAGLNTTVSATRAAAFGLDGNTNVHDEAGKLKIFGEASVTGGFDGLLANQAPGSFTLKDGQAAIQGKRLTLTTTQRLTAEGSGRLVLLG